MPKLKENYIVQKRNVLNEIRYNHMTLQELRFFAIYLSKIKKEDVKTRVVRFPIEDFKAIMELGRMNIEYIRKVTNSLLCKIVNVRNEETGGYTAFQLFKICTVDIDEKGKWYVEIDAHDKALPLLFEYQDNYLSYRLFNALSINSPNQLRMYELLKQYEKVGYRIIGVDELKSMLGIGKNEYCERYDNFKRWVLDACQKALRENTDIKYTYEPHGKRGKGGKILFLKFSIEKNEDYSRQMTLDMFIEDKKQEHKAETGNAGYCDGGCETCEEGQSPGQERIRFLADACNNEFSDSEIVVLRDKMAEKLPYDILGDQLESYNYLMRKYHEMELQYEKGKVKYSRYGYLKSIIGTEYEE